MSVSAEIPYLLQPPKRGGVLNYRGGKANRITRHRSAWQYPQRINIAITGGLPFYRKARGEYVHRIRSGEHYYFSGGYFTSCLRFWCGGETRSEEGLLADPGEKAIFCATCDGRARGAGQLETRMICGRFVKFSPRL